jgi:hypothetical protein
MSEFHPVIDPTWQSPFAIGRFVGAVRACTVDKRKLERAKQAADDRREREANKTLYRDLVLSVPDAVSEPISLEDRIANAQKRIATDETAMRALQLNLIAEHLHLKDLLTELNGDSYEGPTRWQMKGDI